MGTNDNPKKPGAWAQSLRAAALGAATLLLPAMAPAPGPVQPLIDRARQKAEDSEDAAPPTIDQLVMRPGADMRLIAGHRSHSSHRSHRSHSSHYSSRGGGGYAPAPYYPPTPPPTPAPVAPQVKRYKVTLKSGLVHTGTLASEGDLWVLTTKERTTIRIRKSDVKELVEVAP